MFYKKCLKSKELGQSAKDIQNKTKTMSREEEKTKHFKCCDQRFLTKFKLNKHKQHAHGANFRFPCRSCPKRFLTKRSVRIHEYSHRNVEKSSESYCELCERQFKHRANFLKHKQRHTDVVCYYCNRVFTDKETTKKHIADRHEKNRKNFSCVICKKPFAFGNRKILLRHFRTVHARIIPMFCGQCEEPFDNRDKLKSHLIECNKRKSDENDEYWDIEHLIDDDLNLTTEWLNYEMLSDDYLNVDNGESMVEEFLDDAFEMLVGRSEELKCHLCSTVFKTSRDLIMHDITNHGKYKSLLQQYSISYFSSVN